MKKVFLLSAAFVVLFALKVSAQTTPVKKEYTAVRISSPPKMDGVLDDSCWMNVPVATDFTQTEPQPGQSARLRTEVKFLYDNNAVYIGAMMYDPHPDSILCELSKRESVFFGPNADAFGFLVDTYKDGVNAVFLGVTTCGVQADTRVTEPEEFDDSWNAVWESKVKINEQGWVAEIRIPYSALRFPKKDVQEWGINFSRMTRRYSEFSHWNPINVAEQGFVHQTGTLNGIKSIESPLRLSLSPYVSSYLDNYNGSNTFSFNGGADIKYGINESFTMDMTLIPDFGQVKSDNKVLNLSPFETRYDENRPFFTEGTDLFNRAGLFYSRRIGGEPMGYEAAYDALDSNEVMEKNPSTTQLYNATKISGRTKSKLGIGFFNAVTAPSNAVARDTVTDATRTILTQPLANYNVVVLDQGLKNNSFISLINTNVSRDGSTYDANVTGTQFKFSDKNSRFAFQGSGALSQLFYEDSAGPELGGRYQVTLAKVSGNYTAELTERMITTSYDPNDMGYQDKTNQFAHFLNQSYNIYKPFWKINKLTNDLGVDLFMMNDTKKYSWFNVDWETSADFKNHYNWGIIWLIQPLQNYDFYETHVAGRYYLYPQSYGGGTYLGTDQRKKFRVYGKINYRVFNERDRTIFQWQVEPRYRFSNKFNLTASVWSETKNDNTGFVDLVNDTIIFGVRNFDTKENSLEGNYLFTKNMSLSVFVRHYWSQVKYKSYFAVDQEGKEALTGYNAVNDIDFNAFNIDLAFTWQFLPGSEMSVVWKNAILTEGTLLQSDYFEDLDKTVSSPQQNTFSIRILYYLDYQKLRRRK